MYRIKVELLIEMTEICSELVKMGINFDTKKEHGVWIIECTGGY